MPPVNGGGGQRAEDVHIDKRSLHLYTSQSSFTPIDRFKGPPQLTAPFKPPRRLGIDDDSIYELVDEHGADDIHIQGESLDARSTQIWMASIRDEARSTNLPSKLDSLEGPPTKRRKSVPAAQTQSDKREKNTIFSSRHVGGINELDLITVTSKGNSQPLSPPDSGRRIKSKSSSAVTSSELKQSSICSAYPITKPTALVGKDFVPRAPSDGIIRRVGWTTTEDTVKSQFSSLTTTTLDKLAAFRYNANPCVAEPAQPSLPISQRQDQEPSPNLYEPIVTFVSPPITEPYDYSQLNLHRDIDRRPIEASLSDEAEGTAIEADCDLVKRYDPPAHDNLGQKITLVSSYPAQYSLNGFDDHQTMAVAQLNPLYPHHAFVQGSVMDGFMGDDDLLGMLDENADEPAVHKQAIPLNEERVHVQGLPSLVKLSAAGSVNISSAQGPYKVLENLSAHHGEGTTNSSGEGEGYRISTETKMNRSDRDGNGGDVGGANKDFMLDDEFDEGLDDEDIMALMPDTMSRIPWKNILVQRESGDCSFGSQTIPSITVVPSQRFAAAALEIVAQKPGETDVVIPSTNSFLATTNPADDEFFIDADDEAEMLNLPEMFDDVIETATIPQSLAYTFGDDLDRDVYDSSLKYSLVKSGGQAGTPDRTVGTHAEESTAPTISSNTGPMNDPLNLNDEEDWAFIRTKDHRDLHVTDSTPGAQPSKLLQPRTRGSLHKLPQMIENAEAARAIPRNPSSAISFLSNLTPTIIDDDYAYLPPFARPAFPPLALDRSPIIGLSTTAFLRTCFRVGELFKEGARCHALRQDAILELFARVTFSSRDPGSTIQHFQFADLWHDRPPYPSGVLANYKMTGLVESESRVFLEEVGERKMARVLGRLKSDPKSGMGWLMHIVNVRETDWEEVRWTRKVVSRDLCKENDV